MAYKQGRLNFFCFFTLSKGIDDAQLFIGYVLSTKLFFPIGYSSASRALSVVGYVFTTNSPFAFYSFQHNVHIRHRRDNDEHKTVVVGEASLPGLPINGYARVRECISET